MNVRAVLAAVLALVTGTVAYAAIHSDVATEAESSSTPTTQIAAQSELQIRDGIWKEVSRLALGMQFKRLSDLETTYRTAHERTPSGSSKLYQYYAGISSALPQPDERNDCAMPAGDLVDLWMKATPDNPAPFIIKAEMLADRGWCLRGGGYASEVTNQQWQGFYENIAAARALLTENRTVASRDPQYYAVMEGIYRAEGREPDEFRKLLDQASANDPYYLNIYWAAYEYYQPQWFGSPEDVDALARYAAQRTAAKDGEGGYARFYWGASTMACGCWKEAIDWPTMKAAMRDLSDRYPDPWNAANFAKLSCTMEDPETARYYFQLLKGTDGAEAWRGDDQSFRQCRKMAGA